MTKKAFSLLELSVVIIIIGTLVAGVFQGVNLVRASHLTNARLLTTKSNISDIPGLVAWYETSLLASFDTAEARKDAQVSTWYDSAPGSTIGTERKNQLTKIANSSLTYLTKGINKLPSLQFDGSSLAALSLSSFYQGGFSQNTIFIVFRPTFTPNSTAKIILDSDSSASTASIGLKNNAITLNAGLATDTGVTNPASLSIENNYIVNAYFNGSYSQVFINDVASKIGAATLDPGSNARQGLTLGTDKDGNNGFSGLISEVIIYNRILKKPQRRDVMNYLSRKYKITVTGL